MWIYGAQRVKRKTFRCKIPISQLNLQADTFFSAKNDCDETAFIISSLASRHLLNWMRM